MSSGKYSERYAQIVEETQKRMEHSERSRKAWLSPEYLIMEQNNILLGFLNDLGEMIAEIGDRIDEQQR